ncbi:N-acetyllactosaminide 3-alpha-galactosyltransferase [Dictyocaulus viviparus]|uniref:Beta-1,4-N-acetylgalactosaminyltransferase n=1 Tax=Dictyocaulus viviparus TaxID=29172 RepID=A0A0D8XLV1_DICVI|nr:N-acetyllactosaminide 3-alpha-galactosyltransferase [Dictyocaulus viviparus]
MLFTNSFHCCRRIFIIVSSIGILLLLHYNTSTTFTSQKAFKNSNMTNLTTPSTKALELLVTKNITEMGKLSCSTISTKQLQNCSIREYRGRIDITMEPRSIEELERKYQYLQPGGHFTPTDCKALSKIAVVIPFRDREEHLKILLNHMHNFLTKQKLDYAIIVVEQIDGQIMNRAKLLNVGFVESKKLYDWQCFLFHDVDVLPEDDRNLHTCPFENPRHMAVALNKFDYKLAYEGMFGTSSALTTEQFLKTNGFSNRYWGWGGEDDDMYTSCRYKLLTLTKRDWSIDGLNSLSYKLVNITFKRLYTHILVDLLEEKERLTIEKEFCKEENEVKSYDK